MARPVAIQIRVARAWRSKRASTGASSGDRRTNNNRMNCLGDRGARGAEEPGTDVTVVSDSKCMGGWRRAGCSIGRRAGFAKKKNPDLWQAALPAHLTASTTCASTGQGGPQWPPAERTGAHQLVVAACEQSGLPADEEYERMGEGEGLFSANRSHKNASPDVVGF